MSAAISIEPIMPPRLELEAAQFSTVGRVRSVNEDCVGRVEPATAEEHARGWLYALADGVGGGEYGEVAARIAVEAVRGGFRAAAPAEAPGALLPRLVREANQAVYDLGRRARPGGSDMSTTLVTCLLRHDRCYLAHAGDSRCYLVRQGEAKALTRDHVRRVGGWRPWRRRSGMPTYLVRSLGSDMFLNVASRHLTVRPGDVLALTSDGLHDSVTPADLAGLTASGADLRAAARQLADLADQRDGSDNISVVLIRIRAVGSQDAAAGRARF